MPRPKINREEIFKLLALNYSKKHIKNKTGISERTYWMIKREWEEKTESEKQRFIKEVIEERKARERFEDYPIVKKWIKTMQSERIKSWRKRVLLCRKVWKILDRKDPANWTSEDIKLKAIPKLREGRKSIFHYIIAIRSLRPDLKQAIKTKREKAPVNIEWRYAYKQIVQQGLTQKFFEIIKEHPQIKGNPKLELESELIVRMHVTLGCREGSVGEGGIINVEWERVDWHNKTIDVYEGKTGGGFYWLGCPLDLFGDKTFELLKKWHEINGKPIKGKIFPNLEYYFRHNFETVTKDGKLYLVGIYRWIGKALNLPKTIHPHFARKMHASLLKKARVPLEIVAGDPPHGIVGVGWEDLTTLKKFYVTFAEEEIEEAKRKARQLEI
jgi:hypothetical protein